MRQLEQIKQLIGAFADNLAAQERVLRQLTRVLDSLLPDASITNNPLRTKLESVMPALHGYEMTEEERDRLRPHYKATEQFPERPASVECQATVNVPARDCQSDEKYFLPLTEKDSTGRQLGIICNNSWGLTSNTSIGLVSYPSDSIESITKEIHKKD